MRQDLLKGDNEMIYVEGKGTAENFLAKNFFEYPIYEYVGGENPDPNHINYQVRDKDERQVYGPKYIRLPDNPKGSPGIDYKNREEYIKLKYQGNSDIIGRKKN